MNQNEKYFWIRLQGQSMYPQIKNGDEVLIYSCQKSEVNLSDILLFIDEGTKELTLHRLIEDPMITKGDNSYFTESNEVEFLLGRAISVRRKNFDYPIITHSSILYFSKAMTSKNKLKSRISNFFLRLVINLFLLTYRVSNKLDTSKNPAFYP